MSAADSVELRERMINAFFKDDYTAVDLHISLYAGTPATEVGTRIPMIPAEWTVVVASPDVTVENTNELVFEEVSASTIAGIALWDAGVDGTALATAEYSLTVVEGATVRIPVAALYFGLSEQ